MKQLISIIEMKSFDPHSHSHMLAVYGIPGLKGQEESRGTLGKWGLWLNVY